MSYANKVSNIQNVQQKKKNWKIVAITEELSNMKFL